MLLYVLLVALSIALEFGLGSHVKPIITVVRDYGYDLETHTVLSDGYKLTVHRLLRGNQRKIIASTDPPSIAATDIDYGVPLLVGEGILQSSASLLADNNSIAYLLTDQGFDVWLPNYRGNMYSRRHVTLSPKQKDFWNFTLHEMGTEDLPAVIDHVLDTTNRKQLIYHGYSMGTTVFWILATSLPEYQSKIAAMVAIAPVARPSHMILLENVRLRRFLYSFFRSMLKAQIYEVLPYNQRFASTIDVMCSEVFGIVCKFFFHILKYLRSKEMEIKASFKLIPYSPAGVSVRVLIHYIQIVEAGQFQQYDYGTKGNQDRYGSPQPPKYNLKIINLPIYFVSSENDEVARPQDVEWLAQALFRVPERRIKSVKHFRHIDFVLNKNVENLFNLPLLSLTMELAEKHKDSLARVEPGKLDNNEFNFGESRKKYVQ